MCHDFGWTISFYLFILEPKSMPISTQTLSWVLEKIIDSGNGVDESCLWIKSQTLFHLLLDPEFLSDWPNPTNCIYLLVLTTNVHSSPHGVDKTRSTRKKTCFSLSHSATLQRKICHSLNDQKIFYGSKNLVTLRVSHWSRNGNLFGILLEAFCFVLCWVLVKRVCTL